MNLKELKAMIAEEYSNYLAEQEEPAIVATDKDVDATGGDEDAEETLRDIFDMLKDYLEGGDAGADAGDDDAGDDDAGDDADLEEGKKDDEKEVKEELQERFKKLANIIKG